MTVRRTSVVLALVLGVLGVAVAPAFAGRFGGNPSGDAPFVVLTGTLFLPAGSAVSDAVIFNGDATIDGSVRHQVVAFNGDVTISGDVGQNVVALNGKVTLTRGAHVRGDILSHVRPSIASGARVDGRLRHVNNITLNLGQFTAVSRVLVWLATSVSSFLLGLGLVLFAPRAVDTTERTATGRFGASVGIGFLTFFGVPTAAFVAIVILVGIPLGIGVLLALGFLYWLGYTTGAFALGRRLVAAPTHRLLAFLAGWGILRVIALIPILGGLVWFAATVWGLGALVVAGRAAGRAPAPIAPAAPVDAPGPAMIPPPPPIPAAPA
jgi:hypothetical protein